MQGFHDVHSTYPGSWPSQLHSLFPKTQTQKAQVRWLQCLWESIQDSVWSSKCDLRVWGRISIRKQHTCLEVSPMLDLTPSPSSCSSVAPPSGLLPCLHGNQSLSRTHNSPLGHLLTTSVPRGTFHGLPAARGSPPRSSRLFLVGLPGCPLLLWDSLHPPSVCSDPEGALVQVQAGRPPLCSWPGCLSCQLASLLLRMYSGLWCHVNVT